jgi:transcriptional regulator with GAF, ATPase, and Fis domain/tetratricopeptide (TPR) repeat protein
MNKPQGPVRPGSLLGERYHIDARISAGGRGNAFFCHDICEANNRLIARIFHPIPAEQLQSDALGYELSFLRRIRHPHIARIVDFGSLGQNMGLFLIEECIEGKDIFSATINAEISYLMKRISDLVRTLHYLHGRGIVHGDINTSNVILTEAAESNESSELKLLGIGLNRWANHSQKHFTNGSLAFTAPEILMGGTADFSSDLYSLGMMIYLLLARRLPFEDDDLGFLSQRYLQGNIDFRPIELLKNGIQFSQLLARLLDKNPENRAAGLEKTIQSISHIVDRSHPNAYAGGLEIEFSGNRLIGRDKEIAVLKECASRVCSTGRGWTAFITGEAGFGKTRCMEELRGWALLNGWRVVEGACRMREEGAYSPYRQILEREIPVPGEELFRFGDKSRIAASGAFDISMEYAAGQFRDLLTRELVRRISNRPTLLLLHDFHWADEATSSVLDYLSSDIMAHPILMCVSLRPGEKSAAAIEKVAELTVRQKRGEVIPLEPLTQDNVAELVSAITGDPKLKETLGLWIFRSVGGNPFFVEEMLKHLVEQNALHHENGQWKFRTENLKKLEAPANLGAVLQRRIQQLSSSASELADWISLFNRPISNRLLTSTIGWEPAQISEALNELNCRHMVRAETNDQNATVEFRHALISEVVRSAVAGKRLVRMHRRIAEILEKESAAEKNLQELTMHCIEGRLGEKAIRYALSLSAQARSEFAHEDALRCFEYILSDRTGLTAEELCRTAISASDAMFALGLPKQAIRILKSEMNRSNKIGAELKAQMLIQLAFGFRHLGDFAQQQIYCKNGLRILKRNPGSETNTTKAMLLTELAFGAMMQSHPLRGLPFLDQALQAISGCNDAILEGRMQILAAFLHRFNCNLFLALSACKRAESILSSSNNCHINCTALSTSGMIYVELGRFLIALEKHNQAIFLSERIRSVAVRSQVLANYSECLCRMGNVQEAQKIAECAEKSVTESGNPIISSAFKTTWAEIKLSANDYRGAGELIQALLKENRYAPALHTVGHVHFVAASYFFEMGLFDEALKNIDYLARNQAQETPFYEYELTEALRARILFERGLENDAINSLFLLDRAVTKKHWPYQMCLIKLHLGELFISRQEPEPAEKYAKNALRLARAMNSVSLISKARLVLGQSYAIAFQTEPGRKEELWEKAIAELELSGRIIESNSHLETALLSQYQICMLYEKIARPENRLFHAQKAYEFMCNLENQIPSDMVSSFYCVFNRSRIKSDIIRMLNPDREDAVQPGFFGVHEEDKSRMLLRVSNAVNSIQELEPLLEIILDQLIAAMGMQRAVVYLRDESTGKLEMAKGRNDGKNSLQIDETVNRGIRELVCREGSPIVSANLHEDPRVSPGSSGRAFCAPLKTANRVIGLLYTDHSMPVAGLSESTINLFAAFCNLSAISISNALAHQQVLREKKELEQFLARVREDYPEIVGRSACIEALRNRIGMAAASPLDILIVGESGTGKELVARAIHRTGRRKSGIFLPVDCGSLSDSLVEAELFGYRKGAFTGAMENRPGLLETAQGGTIFLDEISNLPFALQAKLLRVLEEREIRRIGDTVQRKIDVQVIAATNRDLLTEFRSGRFRQDLYYRLNKMEIRVPSLRERMEDVPLLIHCFLEKIAESEEGRRKRFSSDALDLLCSYPYPGNIRELKNIVAGSYYSTSGALIGTKELPQEVKRERPEENVEESLPGGRIYREILKSKGNFEESIKKPFLQHRLSAGGVKRILQLALRDSGGRYREAFSILGVPNNSYATTMQFLKRNKCYVDYRPFRRK